MAFRSFQILTKSLKWFLNSPDFQRIDYFLQSQVEGSNEEVKSAMLDMIHSLVVNTETLYQHPTVSSKGDRFIKYLIKKSLNKGYKYLFTYDPYRLFFR